MFPQATDSCYQSQPLRNAFVVSICLGKLAFVQVTLLNTR